MVNSRDSSQNLRLSARLQRQPRPSEEPCRDPGGAVGRPYGSGRSTLRPYKSLIEETASECRIAQVIAALWEGNRLIVSELSRLGRSMLEIMEILSVAVEKGIRVYSVKGNWQLEASLQSKVVAMAFAIAAEIERDLISQRTTEALAARKRAGIRLGRPPGIGKSKLDPFRVEIEVLLAHGASQKFIAQRYGTSEVNLSRWLKKHGLKKPG
ncbi:MAG: recombinase family protein [Anaerolineae bacterium]|nr:recombinase family protein [Anaerolineae bacterium]